MYVAKCISKLLMKIDFCWEYGLQNVKFIHARSVYLVLENPRSRGFVADRNREGELISIYPIIHAVGYWSEKGEWAHWEQYRVNECDGHWY